MEIFMKGAFFLGADRSVKFEVREMTFGELGDHEVLVKNMACGICGTDVHIYHGEEGSASVTPPVVLGHEYSGIVEKVGKSVTLVKPGDHVTMDPNMYCGRCRACRMGRKQNCENLFALGVNVNGGFAQYSRCPETQCFKLNDDVDFDVAAMAEPLACVVHGIDLADIKPGQTVAVIGTGAIGFLMMQMAKLKGASTVIMCAADDVRKDFALSLGADYAINSRVEDLCEKIKEYTGSDGADVVIECVGQTLATEQAVQIAGRGARVLLFSVPSPGATYSLPLYDVFKKELTISGSLINPDTHQRAVNLINSGRLEIKKLITHTYPLSGMEEAILKQMSEDSIKVVVHPQE